MVPKDVTLISESGIRTREDIEYISKVGANGVLIGETFMRQEAVDQAVVDLLGPVERSGEVGKYEGSKA
ncbi:indole-3-glycerol-phosphate synthase [compost metagenome]